MSKDNRYFLMADLLGFKNITLNSSKDELNERIDKWLKLVDDAAKINGIEKIQLISDTIFASVDSSKKDFEKIIRFAQYLLNNGVKQSLPIKGAICSGAFEWGRLIYGNAVIRAYELESSQNWVGVICDNNLPYIQDFFKDDFLICYPPPFKNKPIQLFPVVDWQIPDPHELIKLLTSEGLTKKGETLEWSFGDKINNTLQFTTYKSFLVANKQLCYSQFYGHLPMATIQYLVESKLHVMA